MVLSRAVVFSAIALSATASLSYGDLNDLTAYVYTNTEGQSLPYRLFVPTNYDPARSYPLIMHLHGDYESGTDNVAAANHISTQDLVAHAKTSEYASFVLVPQKPTMASGWDTYGSGQPFTLSLEILNQLEGTYNIDTDRVYLTGLSRGAVGTWRAMASYSNVFAAGAPASGWGNTSQSSLLATKPIWAFQGGADTVVAPTYSRAMITAIQQQGGHPLYTEYYGADHSDTTWNRVFSEYGLYEWMFNQSLNGPIHTPPPPPASDVTRSFTEGFSNSTMTSQLIDVKGNYITTSGQLRHRSDTEGDRSYVRSAQTDLGSHDFTFEVTVNSAAGAAGGNGISFIGFGSGDANPGFFNEPANSIVVHLYAPDYNPKTTLTIPGQSEITLGSASGGQHRVQFVKLGDLLTINFDADYNGEVFFKDYSYTVDLSTLSGLTLDDTNSRIFFGTASNVIGFDDVMLRVNAVPEPATLALLVMGMPLVMRTRRRVQ